MRISCKYNTFSSSFRIQFANFSPQLHWYTYARTSTQLTHVT